MGQHGLLLSFFAAMYKIGFKGNVLSLWKAGSCPVERSADQRIVSQQGSLQVVLSLTQELTQGAKESCWLGVRGLSEAVVTNDEQVMTLPSGIVIRNNHWVRPAKNQA